MLQDLANILAWEATQAFKESYYPGIPDIDVPENHVGVLRLALQREMDREGKSRQRTPIDFGPSQEVSASPRRKAPMVVHEVLHHARALANGLLVAVGRVRRANARNRAS